jgi:hypothetical protein
MTARDPADLADRIERAVRAVLPEQDRYSDTVLEAALMLLDHVIDHPGDLDLNQERHVPPPAPSLYEAVAATHPTLDPLGMTSVMWQLAVRAVADAV